MFDFNLFSIIVGETLNTIDPEGLAIRPTEDAVFDLAVVISGCFNFGMSTEDTALMVLSSETVIV